MRRLRSALLSFSNFSTINFLTAKLLTIIFCILICSTLSFAAAPDRITGPIVSSQLIKLSGGVPRRAQPQYDQGPVDPSFKLSYMTLLTVPPASQQKAIDRLLAQQQDPRSPLYHQWLTPEQYADRFGLSPNDVQKITGWLQSQGFSIREVARGRNFIVFSGTSAQVETAFQPKIHNFDIDGEKHFSNTTPPSIPAALSGVVSGIRGLSDFRPKPHFRRRKPGYTLTISGSTQFFLAPGDVATIYDIGPLYTAGYDGTGQTLAVMGQTDVYLADLNDFRNGFGLSSISGCTTNSNDVITACSAASTYLQYVVVGSDPGAPDTTGDLSESDLDLEWSGAVARNAQLIFVNAPETADGVWDSWYYAVDHNVSKVITMSYGNCEFDEAYYGGASGEGSFASDEMELKKANSLGITFLNSSGDNGAAGCDYNPPGTTSTSLPPFPYLAAEYGLAVSYPASSPEVTGVGGTMIPLEYYISQYWNPNNSSGTTDNGGSALSYIPENGWNDDQELGDYCAVNFATDPFCAPEYAGQVTVKSPQTYQEDWWISSSGGGPSNCIAINGSDACTGGFAQPTWQTVTIPGQTPVRFTPDVSLLASSELPGYIFCTAISELGYSGSASSCASGINYALETYYPIIGGTSSSTPIFAGIVTLLNQYVVKNGFQSAPGLSNINPRLYQIATYNQSAFHQVTTGDNYAPASNVVYCQPNMPHDQPKALQCPAGGTMGYLAANADTATGYNLVTGLGSVNANNLATAFGDLQVATTTAIALAPAPAPQPPFFQGESITFNVTVTNTTGTPNTATGAATLYNSTTAVSGSTTPVAAGIATVSTSELPVATNTVTASYIGIYASSTSTNSVSVTVITPNFLLTPGTGSYTVAPGASTPLDTITVTSTNGFVNTNGQTAVPLTYSCTGLPSESSCTFSPSSTTQSATPTVSIQTTAPSSSQLRSPLGRGNRTFLAMLLPGLFGIVLTVGSRKRAARCMRLLSFMVVLGLSTMWLASCGGGGSSGPSNPGTPAGTYPIQINAKTPAGVSGTAGTVTLTVS